VSAHSKARLFRAQLHDLKDHSIALLNPGRHAAIHLNASDSRGYNYFKEFKNLSMKIGFPRLHLLATPFPIRKRLAPLSFILIAAAQIASPLARAQAASGNEVAPESCATAVLKIAKIKQIDSIKKSSTAYLIKECKGLAEALQKNQQDFWYWAAFNHADVDSETMLPKPSPDYLEVGNLYDFTEMMYPHYELVGINSYLSQCGSARHAEFVSDLRRNDGSGLLASIAARQCQKDSYLRVLARSYSSAIGAHLRDELDKEKKESLNYFAEFFQGWQRSNPGAKTKNGEDGVKYLTQKCKDYQEWPKPHEVHSFIQNAESAGFYKAVPEIRDNLISLSEAKSMMSPFWANVNSCKFALQSLKEKNANAARQQSASPGTASTSSGGSSYWKNFRPTAVNLERMCVSAANMSMGQNVRFQYILMGARLNGLSAENQLAITRYMRANCPEYLR
jgi:hypothetical protein